MTHAPHAPHLSSHAALVQVKRRSRPSKETQPSKRRSRQRDAAVPYRTVASDGELSEEIRGIYGVRRVTTLCFHRYMELENFGDALDALVESGAEHYGDCASMVVLHQMQARLDSFVTEATAAFEVGEEWAAEGAKTAASG